MKHWNNCFKLELHLVLIQETWLEFLILLCLNSCVVWVVKTTIKTSYLSQWYCESLCLWCGYNGSLPVIFWLLFCQAFCHAFCVVLFCLCMRLTSYFVWFILAYIQFIRVLFPHNSTNKENVQINLSAYMTLEEAIHSETTHYAIEESGFIVVYEGIYQLYPPIYVVCPLHGIQL